MIHDIIKIKYVQLGFIQKNYPYHLISDEEMFYAFIDLNNGFTSNLVDPDAHFFDMYYPNPFAENPNYEDYVKIYDNLKSAIVGYINDYLNYRESADADEHKIPDWVYTYMLGEVVYKQSDYLDIQDTLSLLGCSNIDNEFTTDACIACYNTSKKYISTLTFGMRPPTIFGEPHVIKYLRLEN